LIVARKTRHKYKPQKQKFFAAEFAPFVVKKRFTRMAKGYLQLRISVKFHFLLAIVGECAIVRRVPLLASHFRCGVLPGVAFPLGRARALSSALEHHRPAPPASAVRSALAERWKSGYTENSFQTDLQE
jgi:hypothetical protein